MPNRIPPEIILLRDNDAPTLQGRAAYSLPLSRLAEYAAWLRDEARPLLFFCRSGNRSLKAVQCLQGLGRERVWHLAGGLALLRN